MVRIRAYKNTWNGCGNSDIFSEAKDGSGEQLQACTRRTLRSDPFTNIDARNR